MATLLIELNDSGIGIALDGEVLDVEPGYVQRTGKGLTIGRAALGESRRNPQHVSNRYWDTLDQETLGRDSVWQQTPADLAYAQLIDIWQRYHERAQRVVLLAPASFSRGQLGLILGMCRKGDIPVVSMVDSAVAALAEPPDGNALIHLDLTLHRIVATRCVLDDGLKAVEHAELDQLGLVNFQAKWAAAIADVCVRATRYDPMHTADAEQRLYASLDGLLDEFERGAERVDLRIDQLGDNQTLTVERGSLVQAAVPLYRHIVSLIEGLRSSGGKLSHLVLSDRFAGFVDLAASLQEACSLPVSVLAQHSALHGAHAGLAQFEQVGDNVGLIRERAVQRGERAARAQDTIPTTPPSHVLVAGEAYALGDVPFVVGTATKNGSWGYRANGAVKGVSRNHCSILHDGGRVVLRDHSSYGTFVNGQRVDGEQRLAAGDVVRLGNPGVELKLVLERRCDG